MIETYVENASLHCRDKGHEVWSDGARKDGRCAWTRMIGMKGMIGMMGMIGMIAKTNFLQLLVDTNSKCKALSGVRYTSDVLLPPYLHCLYSYHLVPILSWCERSKACHLSAWSASFMILLPSTFLFMAPASRCSDTKCSNKLKFSNFHTSFWLVFNTALLEIPCNILCNRYW